MALSPQYSWPEPDNSSLVKNGAQDIRALGDAIDTSVWNVGFGQAGKNKIINGDFYVNQRGFTSTTSNNTYVFDRFRTGAVDGTSTFTAQTFTAGTAPVAGYEGKNYIDLASTGQTLTTAKTAIEQRIEDARILAGQTVTVSFWAKAASGTPSIAAELLQVYGSGASPATGTSINAKTAITTSWVRYSITLVLPSLTGATLNNADSHLRLTLWTSAGTAEASRSASLGIQTATISLWGIQVESGAKATPFQTASGGSIQGELAMCQRYYYKWVDGLGSGGVGASMGLGANYNATQMNLTCSFPVTMRTNPTLVATTGSAYYKFERNGAQDDFNSLTIFHSGVSQAMLYNATEISGTAGHAGSVSTQNASASVAFSAEL